MAAWRRSRKTPVKQCKRSVKPVCSRFLPLTFGTMNRILSINLIVMAAIAGAGLLVMQAVNRSHSAANERRFSERVNLALRQTAHRLLAIEGDNTSRIPPVQQPESLTWLIRLEQNFNYDSLPVVLHNAFVQHHVEGDYFVAVLDCENDDLMLGYTASILTANTEVACQGREKIPGCSNLRVSFLDPAATSFPESTWGLFAIICFAMLVYPAYSLYKFLGKKRLPEKTPQTGRDVFPETAFHNEAVNGKAGLLVGRSSLYMENQKLVSNGIEKDLTYREAKLLHLFSRHANQLLERDLILKSVWEDEGIIVGRSVDVFVSRLRKLLKDDDSVRIVNVHGVGYRLEVLN